MFMFSYSLFYPICSFKTYIKDSTVLASNNFTSVQVVGVNYKNRSFWATQYHPVYDLKEMARLIVARE